VREFREEAGSTRLFKPIADVMLRVHRRSGGKRLSKMMGFPVVVLTTKGAKSGLERVSPGGGFPDGDDAWLVVASLARAPRHPAWFINMVQHPDEIWLEGGAEKFTGERNVA
jgi:hypothetical protein